jgi:hypothetical protein
VKSLIITSLMVCGLVQIADPTFQQQNDETSAAVNSIEPSTQQPGFIPVQGSALAAKVDAASRQARATNAQARFWTAWAFDARPGVAVDYEWRSKDGKVRTGDGFNVSFDRDVETRNLGVFLLHEPSGINRVEAGHLQSQG